MAIEDHIKTVVDDGLTVLIGCANPVTVEENTQRFCKPTLPILLRHFCAIRFEPGNVVEPGFADGFSLEPIFSGENGMAQAEPNEIAGETNEVLVGLAPIDPGDGIILAIGVIITLLAMAQLVAGQ